MTDIQRPVRTRFAPSPTGYLHIGSLRTVIFNWLFARHHGGQFLLRIEDTDRKRYVEGAEQQLMESIQMVGLDIDEGPGVGGPYAPYHQSERLPLYQQHAEILIERGHAYRCYCSSERLEQVNKERQERKEPPGYDRHCRNLSAEEHAARKAEGAPSVVRLATPLDGETIVPDMLRGNIVVQNRTLNDPVLLKSDGFPTYHLAAMVDDHVMEISHIMRADEWIATAPYHVLIYQFFGWEMPHLIHLPQVLGPDGKKYSKRHGATAVNEFIEQGFLPEALINALALIGWSYDETTEIMSREELIERFSIERINPAGGSFSQDKLLWFNGVYIRKMAPEELAERIVPFMQRAGLLGEDVSAEQRAGLVALMPLIQERLKLLGEAPEQLAMFFRTPQLSDPQLLIPKKTEPAAVQEMLRGTVETLEQLEGWDVAGIEAALRGLSERTGVKVGTLFMPIRVAISGSTVSPPLFESLAMLGREESLGRLRAASEALAA